MKEMWTSKYISAAVKLGKSFTGTFGEMGTRTEGLTGTSFLESTWYCVLVFKTSGAGVSGLENPDTQKCSL